MEDKTELHHYQWIINEGLLRDEGVLFGIAGTAIEDKIEAIRDYYRIKKASLQTKREQLENEIEGIPSYLRHPVLSVEDRPESEGEFPGDTRINLVPAALQLILYAGICYFNFFLETYWLSPVIRSISICTGLYLFGLFSVFLGRSILYNSEKSLGQEGKTGEYREKWKIYLEELSVPLVVSLFIAVLPGKAYPLAFSILAALLFFLLFLLGGKGLVNTFYRLRVEGSRYFQQIRHKKWKIVQSTRLRTLQGELTEIIGSLTELSGEEEYKIHILTSEYKLGLENSQLSDNLSLKN